MRSAAKTLRRSIKNSGDDCFKSCRNYLDLVLPIKDASKGLLLANSFLVLATSSAAPGLGTLVAFFIFWAVAKARFLYKSVFFIPATLQLFMQLFRDY